MRNKASTSSVIYPVVEWNAWICQRGNDKQVNNTVAMKKDKKTNNDLQNTTQKLKIVDKCSLILIMYSSSIVRY